MPRLRPLLLALLLPLTARALPPEQETFWSELRALCGQAYDLLTHRAAAGIKSEAI